MAQDRACQVKCPGGCWFLRMSRGWLRRRAGSRREGRGCVPGLPAGRWGKSGSGGGWGQHLGPAGGVLRWDSCRGPGKPDQRPASRSEKGGSGRGRCTSVLSRDWIHSPDPRKAHIFPAFLTQNRFLCLEEGWGRRRRVRREGPPPPPPPPPGVRSPTVTQLPRRGRRRRWRPSRVPASRHHPGPRRLALDSPGISGAGGRLRRRTGRAPGRNGSGAQELSQLW